MTDINLRTEYKDFASEGVLKVEQAAATPRLLHIILKDEKDNIAHVVVDKDNLDRILDVLQGYWGLMLLNLRRDD